MILKTTLQIAIFLIAPSLANAGYAWINTKQLHKYNPYAQIDQQEGSLWVSLNRIREGDGMSTEFLLQEMRCSPEETPRKIKAPGFYFSISSISVAHSHSLVIPVVDYLGQWHLAQIDAKSSKINRTLPMKDFVAIRAGATSRKGYFLGGSDTQSRPLLLFYSSDLNSSKVLNEKNSKEGEVSSVFNRGEEIAAIYNERSEENSSIKFSSELRMYSPAGAPVANVRLDGLDGTGMALEDGSVVVSYWQNGKIHMERIGSDLSRQWKIPLHQVEGIASIQGKLLQVGKSLAWVGANNNKLLVHRVERDGSGFSTRIESSHGLSAPQPLTYAASSYGDEIHVRGRTNRGKGATLSAITEFCIVEKP